MICINCFLSNVYLFYVTVDPNNDHLKELLNWYIFSAGSLRDVSWNENSNIDAIVYMSVFKRKDMSAVSNVSFAYIINKRKISLAIFYILICILLSMKVYLDMSSRLCIY